MDFVLVYITAANMEEAEKLASLLVREGLAGCVNVVPRIKSYFRWEGDVQVEEETLVLVKTRANLASRVVDRVKEVHSYSVPAVLVLEVKEGNPDFLDWLAGETGTTYMA